jgi:8-oxo-dGTP pyrophosphatase MutT (NUDIX family)
MFSKKVKKQTLALLVVDDLQVLMGKKNNDDTWSFIGGGVEDNETPLQGMMREIREEVGLTYGEKDLEFVSKYIADNREIYVYKGIVKSSRFDMPKNITSEYDIDHEFSELRFFDIVDLIRKREDIELTFPYDENVGIQALKKLYGDKLTFDSIDMDSIEENLLYQIKNETGLKKLKLIKEFKSLPAMKKLKLMKEYQNSLNSNEEPTQTIDEHLETPPVEEPTSLENNEVNNFYSKEAIKLYEKNRKELLNLLEKLPTMNKSEKNKANSEIEKILHRCAITI